jgi:hypothetical protein
MNERKKGKSLDVKGKQGASVCKRLSEGSFRLMFIRHKMFNEDNLTFTLTLSNHAKKCNVI